MDKKMMYALACGVMCVMGLYKFSLRSAKGPEVEVGVEEKTPVQKAAEAADALQLRAVADELAAREQVGEETKAPEKPEITVEKAYTNLVDAYKTGDTGDIITARNAYSTAQRFETSKLEKSQLTREKAVLEERLDIAAEELSIAFEEVGVGPEPTGAPVPAEQKTPAEEFTQQASSFSVTITRLWDSFTRKISNFFKLNAGPDVNINAYADALADPQGEFGKAAQDASSLASAAAQVSSAEVTAVNQKLAKINDAVSKASELQQKLDAIKNAATLDLTDAVVKITDAKGSTKYVASDPNGQPVSDAKEFDTFFEYSWDQHAADFEPGSRYGFEVNKAYENLFTPDIRSQIPNFPTDVTKVTQEQIDKAFDILTIKQEDENWPSAQFKPVRNASNVLRAPRGRAGYDAFLEDYARLAKQGAVDQNGIIEAKRTLADTMLEGDTGRVIKFAITDIQTIQDLGEQVLEATEKTSQANQAKFNLEKAQSSLIKARSEQQAALGGNN